MIARVARIFKDMRAFRIYDGPSEVHRQAIAHVATLGEDALSAPNPTGLPLGGAGQVRDVIMHAIRHEGSHIGHLGWLCKLHGIPTV